MTVIETEVVTTITTEEMTTENEPAVQEVEAQEVIEIAIDIVMAVETDPETVWVEEIDTKNSPSLPS